MTSVSRLTAVLFKYSLTRQISVNEPFCISQAAWIGKEISAFNFTAIAILFVEVPLGRNPRENKTFAAEQKTATGGQCVCATTAGPILSST